MTDVKSEQSDVKEQEKVQEPQMDAGKGGLSGMGDFLGRAMMSIQLQRSVMDFVKDITKTAESAAIGFIISHVEMKLAGNTKKFDENFDLKQFVEIKTDAGDAVDNLIHARVLFHFTELKHSVELAELKPDMSAFETAIIGKPEGVDVGAYIKYKIVRASIISISEAEGATESAKDLLRALDASFMEKHQQDDSDVTEVDLEDSPATESTKEE